MRKPGNPGVPLMSSNIPTKTYALAATIQVRTESLSAFSSMEPTPQQTNKFWCYIPADSVVPASDVLGAVL